MPMRFMTLIEGKLAAGVKATTTPPKHGSSKAWASHPLDQYPKGLNP